MNSNASPDIDPANNESLAGTLRFAFSKFMQGIDGMLPAQVINVSEDRTRVQVQLLISVVSTSGQVVSRPQIASVPVLTLGGGGFFLSFPLVPGNLGWVIANDRDISLFLQSYEESAPNTGRVKNFADGLFIPDIMTGFTIQPMDANNAVLSNKEGTIKIAISSTGVIITAPTITLDGAVSAPDGATITGAVTINGTEHVTGTITGDAGANLSGTILLSGLGSYTFTMTP